ncbi:hypothetical protein Pelo_13677 [Pelomyxa schiedti]|nr:hypothetical protein Pelo_13677 [Pelomyxa schiedti]
MQGTSDTEDLEDAAEEVRFDDPAGPDVVMNEHEAEEEDDDGGGRQQRWEDSSREARLLLRSFVGLSARANLASKLSFGEALVSHLTKFLPYGGDSILWTAEEAPFLAEAAQLCLAQVTDPAEGWRRTESDTALVQVMVRAACHLGKWESVLAALDGSARVKDREALVVAFTGEILAALASSLVRATPSVVSNVVGHFFAELLDVASGKGHWRVAWKAFTMIFSDFLPNPRYNALIPPHEAQLRAIVDRMYTMSPWHANLFTSCVSLAEVLPDFVKKLSLRYLSDLSALSFERYSALRMVEGWDALPIRPPILCFIKEYITIPFVNAIINSLERSEYVIAHQPFAKTAYFVAALLKTLTLLSLVDKQAHGTLLQFAENQLTTPAPDISVSRRTMAALLLIPVALSNGVIPEQLVIKALLFACEPGSPGILETLFSVRQLMNCLTTVESLRTVLLATVKRYLPEFPEVAEAVFNALQTTAPPSLGRKRRYNSEEGLKVFLVHVEKDEVQINGEYIQTMSQISLIELSIKVSTIVQTLLLIAATTSSLQNTSIGLRAKTVIFCTSRSSIRSMERFLRCCFQPNLKGITEDNDDLAVTLLKQLPQRKRAAICFKRDKVAMRLLQALYVSDCGTSLNARKSPFTRSMACSSNATLDTLVTWCILQQGKDDSIMKLVLHSDPEYDPAISIKVQAKPPKRVSLLQQAINLNNLPLAIRLLPFCNPHLPLSLFAEAILHGPPQMVQLLWFHGMVIPPPDKMGAKASAGSRSLSEFHRTVLTRLGEQGTMTHLRHPAAWDPAKHTMFPWWFKELVLVTVLLCWLRNSTRTAPVPATTGSPQITHNREQLHPIGRLPSAVAHHVLSFLAPNHWL